MATYLLESLKDLIKNNETELIIIPKNVSDLTYYVKIQHDSIMYSDDADDGQYDMIWDLKSDQIRCVDHSVLKENITHVFKSKLDRVIHDLRHQDAVLMAR